MDIIRIIAEKRRQVSRLLVTIDGPCASGKTTLARELAEKTGASVVHTDDFVIPHAQKTPEGWQSPAGIATRNGSSGK